MLLYLFALLPAVTLSRRLDQFIIGGSDAAEGSWPWQLSLRTVAGTHSCGASLIGAQRAVTAAQCVGNTATTYTILAGTNQRSCDSCDGAETRRLNAATRHPDFVENGNVGYPNDIATVHWTNPLLPVSGKIQYVTLSSSTNQVDSECYITGWGRTSACSHAASSSSLPENLQEAYVNVLTTDECHKYWSSTLVTDSQVCVFDKQLEARASCNGDTGSPLVCKTTLGRWELVGVTSWGRTTCSTAYPSVFTRISSYTTWIGEN